MVMIYRTAMLSAILSASIGITAPQAKASTNIPFVGCRSDGQVGPQNAPTGKPKTVNGSSPLAQSLAYYEASDGLGVLAPRGWYCFETYGSDGSNLYVTPTPLITADLFSDRWKGISGYGIQLSQSIGDTSGRFAVAQIIARVFPAHWDFVRRVIAEGVEPATSFPYGPYPADRLTYKNKETVEYVTPPNTEGLGTRSFFIKDGNAIGGVAVLTGEELSLTHLSARLAPEMSNLLPIITHSVEQEGSQSATSRSATGDEGTPPPNTPSHSSQTATPPAPTIITLPNGSQIATMPNGNKIETLADGSNWIVLHAGWKGTSRTGAPLQKYLAFQFTKAMPTTSVFRTFIITDTPESDVVDAPQSERIEIEGDCHSQTYDIWGVMPYSGKNGGGMPDEDLATGPEGVYRKVTPDTPIWYVFDAVCHAPHS
jgi:hypothetical protein